MPSWSAISPLDYPRDYKISNGTLIEIPDYLLPGYGALPLAISHLAFADCVAWEDEDSTNKGVELDPFVRLRNLIHAAPLGTTVVVGADVTFKVQRVARAPRASSELTPVLLRLFVERDENGDIVQTITKLDEWRPPLENGPFSKDH